MKPVPSVVTLILLLPAICSAQTFRNMDFQETCDSSATQLCYWNISWGGKTACTIERSGKNQWLSIAGTKENSVGFVEQTVPVPTGAGLQVLEVSADISSQEIEGKGAGINVGIYDSTGTLLFTKDMGYASFNWVHGTTAWKRYTVSAICPENTTTIKLGAILYGKGTARFDNYSAVLTPIQGREASTLATHYITAACDTIAKHSLMNDSVDLAALKRTALQIAGPAKTYADCHLAIVYLLRALGDEHSFFMTPEEVAGWEHDDSPAANIQYAEFKVINRCGYISVPPFHGGNTTLMQAYSDSIQAALRKLDRMNIKGWIIDLRQNTGGNMSPMIAGLGPLFDSERLGSLVENSGHAESWFYRNDAYFWESEKILAASNPVRLLTKRPTAVLIGHQTGSSGEIVVISFIGNSRTKIFGMPTWGLTTGNGDFDLPDGARMMLASTIMADRNGKLYHGPIEPDERILQSDDPANDAEITAAVRWILDNN